MMAGFTKLPTALLQITPNASLDFISQDFIPLGTDYKVIKPDPSLKFITVNDQQLSFAPKVRDIGTHIIRLYATTDSKNKYYQEVRVKVGYSKDSPDFLKYKEIEGKIIKISRTGIVQILFN